MATLSELFVKLGLDLNAQSFLKGQLALDGIKAGLNALAGAARLVTRELVDSTLGLINEADAMQDLSDRTGVSADALQSLGYAGQFADVSMEQVGESLKFLSRNMVEAVEGNAELRTAFRRISVQLVDSSGHIRKTDDVLLDLADRFSKMPATAARSTLAMKLFGKSGAELLPLLLQGKDKLGAFRTEFQQLTGGGFSQETIDKAGEFNDNLARISTGWRGIKMQVMEAVLPTLIEVSQSSIDWLKANQQLIRTKVREWVEGAVKAVKAFVAGVRQWIEDHGGLNAVIEQGVTWLKAFGTIIAAIKVAEFVQGLFTIVNALKVLKFAIAGTGIGALILVIVAAGAAIIENWDDVRAFFILVGDTAANVADVIQKAFMQVFDWVAGKLEWLYKQVRKLVSIATNPFSINNTSTSGTRGVAQGGPTWDKLRALNNQARAGTLGIEGITGPALVETGGRGGNAFSVSAPVTINATRVSGESDEAFAQRIAGHVDQHLTRTMREAQAGINP